MFDLVLFEPEIPPNTGNIMRLCANVGAILHLVEPLGFSLSDRRLRRAGMDYRDRAGVRVHADWTACVQALATQRLFALSTRGGERYCAPRFRPGDGFVLGSETRGLPAALLASFPPGQVLRIPMVACSRSLNLANAAAVVLYEAWRQNAFPGGA